MEGQLSSVLQEKVTESSWPRSGGSSSDAAEGGLPKPTDDSLTGFLQAPFCRSKKGSVHAKQLWGWSRCLLLKQHLWSQPPSQRGDGPEGRGESLVRRRFHKKITSAGAKSYPHPQKLSIRLTSSAAICLLPGARMSCRRAPCRPSHRNRCCGRSTRYFHSPLPRPRLS